MWRNCAPIVNPCSFGLRTTGLYTYVCSLSTTVHVCLPVCLHFVVVDCLSQKWGLKQAHLESIYSRFARTIVRTEHLDFTAKPQFHASLDFLAVSTIWREFCEGTIVGREREAKQ